MNILLGISVCCLLLSWLVPIHFLPWASFYNEYIAFAALGFLWLAKVLETKLFSAFSVASIALILLISLQYWFGVYSFLSDPVLAALYIFGGFAAYQIGLSCMGRQFFLEKLSLLLVFGGVVGALLGIMQWLEFRSSWVVTPSMARSVGNLAQPNNFASLLFWSVCALSFLFIKHVISFGSFFLIALVLAFGLTVSDSRTPLLQFLFFVISFFWCARKNFLKPKYAAALLPLCLFFVLYFSFPAIDAFVFAKDSGQLGLIERPYSFRMAIWSSLLFPIINSPFLGYGVGQVSVAQFTFLNDFGRTVEFVEHSHNILLDIIVWFGPFFGIALILFSLYWIGRHFWRMQTTEHWFLFACIGSLIIHGLVEYPLEYAYFLLPFSLMLGLMDNGCVKSISLVRYRHVYSAVLFALSLIPMVMIWQEYRALEEDHRLMRAQNFGLVGDRSLSLSDDVILLNGKREYIRVARYEARQNMPEEDLKWMKKVVYRYPFAVAIYRYSVALALNGRETEAASELGKIQYFFGQDTYEHYRASFDRSIATGVEQ